MRLFSTNLGLLVHALRELHEHVRLLSIPTFELSESQHYQESMDAACTLPLRVDLVFYYLRRLADDFACSGRFILYRNLGAAPWKFANVKGNTRDLLCDIDAFSDVLNQYTSWFSKLRNREDSEVTGIRDVLAHRGGTVHANHIKVGDGSWVLNVNLRTPGGFVSGVPDLIIAIREIISELCIFWTKICEIFRKDDGYHKWIGPSPWGDCFVITGIDEDTCGFWPEL